MSRLTEDDVALVEEARVIIAKRFKEGFHEVGAAVRTQSGAVFAAVHLEAYVGRVAVCAEAVAIGMAAAQGDTDLATIVAVDRNGSIVAPCGMCRELIADYAPDCRVILGEKSVSSVAELLPNKYRRHD